MMTDCFVFDTNILVSAALRRNSLPREALDKALLHGRILVSEETVSELREVLFRPKFDKYVSIETRLAFLTTLLSEAEEVLITDQIIMCRDPKDDKFLDVAVNGGAVCIISGDNDLLVLHPFREIPILVPRDFLNLGWRR